MTDLRLQHGWVIAAELSLFFSNFIVSVSSSAKWVWKKNASMLWLYSIEPMTDLRKHLCDLFVSFSHAAVNHPAVLSQLQLSQCFFYSYLFPFAKVVPSLKSRIMQESTLLVFSNNKMSLQLKCSWLFVFEAYRVFRIRISQGCDSGIWNEE